MKKYDKIKDPFTVAAFAEFMLSIYGFVVVSALVKLMRRSHCPRSTWAYNYGTCLFITHFIYLFQSSFIFFTEQHWMRHFFYIETTLELNVMHKILFLVFL